MDFRVQAESVAQTGQSAGIVCTTPFARENLTIDSDTRSAHRIKLSYTVGLHCRTGQRRHDPKGGPGNRTTLRLEAHRFSACDTDRRF